MVVLTEPDADRDGVRDAPAPPGKATLRSRGQTLRVEVMLWTKERDGQARDLLATRCWLVVHPLP